MTEEQWLACTNLDTLLEYLSHKKRQTWLNRKLRLFGCACCRRLWHLFTDDRYRRAVEVAERFADGLASLAELQAAGAAVEEVGPPQTTTQHGGQEAVQNALATPLKWNVAHAAREARFAAYGAAVAVAGRYPAVPSLTHQTGPGWPVWRKTRWGGAARPEREQQLLLPRDIIGDPFREVSVQPAWLRWHDGTAVKVARGIYEGRAFDRLPVLADALEEAGCTDRAVLDHCRGPGPHVRGCLVVDLVLGKQ